MYAQERETFVCIEILIRGLTDLQNSWTIMAQEGINSIQRLDWSSTVVYIIEVWPLGF